MEVATCLNTIYCGLMIDGKNIYIIAMHEHVSIRPEDFFQVSPRFSAVDQEGCGPSTLSPEDYHDFWREKPVDEIWIATGSLRKVIQVLQNLYGFSLFALSEEKTANTILDDDSNTALATIPLQQHYYFRKHIYNGNETLKEDKVLLGYYHGVPTYSKITDGETESNDNPLQEAVNKVLALRKEAVGKNVLIFATDAVESRPDRKKLGKPMYNPEYKTDRELYNHAEADRRYLARHYPEHTEIEHINGVALYWSDRDQLITDEICLNIPINQETLARVIIDEGCAGGGVSQQLINWLSEDSVLGVGDKKTVVGLIHPKQRAELEKRQKDVGEDHNTVNLIDSLEKNRLYTQITGMPAWKMDQMIRASIES